MVMKRYSAFLKLQHYLNLTIRLFSVYTSTLVGRRGLIPLERCIRWLLQYCHFAKVQSVDSTAPAYLAGWRKENNIRKDWASRNLKKEANEEEGGGGGGAEEEEEEEAEE